MGRVNGILSGYFADRLFCTAFLLSLAGCSGQVTTPDGRLADLDIGDVKHRSSSGGIQIGEPLDLQAEEEIATGCLTAWRQALAGDDDGAMLKLKDLEKKHPKATTVVFMMGQIAEHGGRKEDAVRYYAQVAEKSKSNNMYLFKLAESLRATGDANKAAARYRELIERFPDFAPGRVGLARALMEVDRHSREAARQIQVVLDTDPDNKEALKLREEMERRR